MASGVTQKTTLRRSIRRECVYKTSQKNETHRVILLNWPRENHISCQQKRSQASPTSLDVPHFAVAKKSRSANKIKDARMALKKKYVQQSKSKIVERDTHLCSLKEEICFFLCDVMRPTFLFAQLCGFIIDLEKCAGKI
jgi:hypothetical protein